MKTVAFSLAGALAGALTFGAFASAVHAEPSWSDRDRSELYRVQRQQVYSDARRSNGNGYYAAPREEYYGYDDRAPEDRRYRVRPRYYRW